MSQDDLVELISHIIWDISAKEEKRRNEEVSGTYTALRSAKEIVKHLTQKNLLSLSVLRGD